MPRSEELVTAAERLPALLEETSGAVEDALDLVGRIRGPLDAYLCAGFNSCKKCMRNLRHSFTRHDTVDRLGRLLSVARTSVAHLGLPDANMRAAVAAALDAISNVGALAEFNVDMVNEIYEVCYRGVDAMHAMDPAEIPRPLPDDLPEPLGSFADAMKRIRALGVKAESYADRVRAAEHVNLCF